MGFPSNFLVDFSRTRAFYGSLFYWTCATSWPQSSVSGLARNNMTMEEEMACLVNKLMNRLKIILQRSRSKALRDPQEISLHVVGVPTAHKCAVSLERLTCKKRSGRRSTGAPSLTQTSWTRCPPPTHLFPQEFRKAWLDIFRKNNTPLPSSASVERLKLFSFGSDIFRSKRAAQLAAKNFEHLIFTKENFKIIEKNQYQLLEEELSE